MSPGYPPLRQVDVHTHAMPLPVLEWLAQEGRADLSRLADGLVGLDPEVSGVPATTVVACRPEAYDVGARLEYMDDAGVEVQAVSLSPYLAGVAADRAFARELVQRANDELAEFVAQAPAQLVGLGSVAVGQDGVADEALRCLDDLGMPGVMIGTHGGGRDLTDSLHEPLWELLTERRSFALLHPVAGAGGAGQPGVPWADTLAAGVDLALTVAAMVRSGLVERHDFPLCLAYGGGALPALRGVLQRGWERLGEGAGLRRSPVEQLRRLYYDTATFDVLQLKQLVEFVGPDHVLMGSDHTSDLADADPIGVVEACQFGPVQEMIIGVNAMALLGLRP